MLSLVLLLAMVLVLVVVLVQVVAVLEHLLVIFGLQLGSRPRPENLAVAEKTPRCRDHLAPPHHCRA